MKRFYLLVLLPIALLLSGCQVPFLTSEKDDLKTYTLVQAEMIKISEDANDSLHESLEKQVNDALQAIEVGQTNEEESVEGEKFDTAPLITEIRQVLRVNQLLLKEVEEKPVSGKSAELKSIYVGVLKNRISSYEDYIHVLDVGNIDTFNKTIVKNKAKDEGVLTKALIDLNQLLEVNKLDKRKTLLPEEETKKEVKK